MKELKTLVATAVSYRGFKNIENLTAIGILVLIAGILLVIFAMFSGLSYFTTWFAVPAGQSYFYFAYWYWFRVAGSILYYFPQFVVGLFLIGIGSGTIYYRSHMITNPWKGLAFLVLAIAIMFPISGGVYAGCQYYRSHQAQPVQPQGSMNVMSFQIFPSNPNYVAVNLANTGTIDLTISSAYIDGTPANVTGNNLTFSPNQEMTVTFAAPSGLNISDGAEHWLTIIASDGTPVGIPITYQPNNGQSQG